MTPITAQTITRTLAALRAQKPGANEEATRVILALSGQIAQAQTGLIGAAAALEAVQAHQAKGAVLDAAALSDWAQQAQDSAAAVAACDLPALAAGGWQPIDMTDATNPPNIDLLMAAQWCEDPKRVAYFVGQFRETGIYVDNSPLSANWNVTHYAPLVAPGASGQDGRFLAGRAAGMIEAANMVRNGHEVSDPHDNYQSTVMEDWDTFEDAADAIEAAITATP